MPGGRTKFQEKWLETRDGNGDLIGSWCINGRTEYNAYCLLCKCNVSFSNSGISQILQHSSKKKHIKSSSLLNGQRTLVPSDNHNASNNNPSVSSSENAPISMTNTRSLCVALTIDQTVTRADALWAMKIAVSDFSFESCKDIVPLFKIMFEGHPIANAMQLGERKVSYIISHGLGPYFHSETVSDLIAAVNDGYFFSLSFDETTTAQIKKQLDFHVRYWSPKYSKIISAYLTSIFLGHADAELILRSILKAMEIDNLPLDKMLMLSMDGPNVNLLVAKKLNEELSKLGSKLVDLDTCSLHKVHNCFSKALDDLPLNVDEFATDLFSFFRHSAARREDLQKLQKLLECDEKFLLRHVNSRWLTLGPVVLRILSVYPALKDYFLQFIPKQKYYSTLQYNARYKRIVCSLKDSDTIVYLEFIAALTPYLQCYLELFQTEAPLVHLLYSEMNKLLRSILLKFLKDEFVGTLEGEKLINLDINNYENYKKLKDLDVGIGTKKALFQLKENKRKDIMRAMRSCLVKLARLLIDKLPLNNVLLRDLEILHPLMCKAKNDVVKHLCINLKALKLENRIIDCIAQEWTVYSLDDDVKKVCEEFELEGTEQRIDIYWQKISQLKEILTGKQKYPNLSNLMKNCLTLYHSNSDVERGFSLNNNILSKSRLNLSEATIIGLRHVKCAVQNYGGILSVPITPKLLNSVAKSYSVYAAEKESLAKAAEEEKKKRKLDEAEQQEIERNKKQKSEKEEKVKKLKEKIEFLQDELKSANTCLTENNEKLRNALKNKDYMTVTVLSNLIQTSTSTIQRITGELSSAQETRNKL